MAKRITTILVPLNAGQLNYTLPPSNLIDGKRIHQITVRDVVAVSHMGGTTPATNVLQSAYMSINVGTVTVASRIPLTYFVESVGCECRCMPEISSINLAQTEIAFKVAPANNSYLELIVCYEDTAANC